MTMMVLKGLVVLRLVSAAAAQATLSVTASSGSTTPSIPTTGQTTAVTGCQSHESEIECVDGSGQIVLVSLTATPTGEIAAQYTGCHGHDDEMFCVDASGDDVLVIPQTAVAGSESAEHSDEDGHDHGNEGDHADEHNEGGMDCHFHAGVEHCVPAGQSESSTVATPSCGIETRDYDIPLRIGSIFIMLTTSSIAVFAPILLARLSSMTLRGSVFTVVKQFGTGVIIAVAFVHLYTHASLLFANECLGTLAYEATASALVMAGISLAFVLEYVGHRIVLARRPSRSDQSGISRDSSRSRKQDDQQTNGAGGSNTLAELGHSHGSPWDPTNVNSKVSVFVMEVGILFHSILIGLTLVVAGDSFYRTLLAVIIFHQFFEGLALGARIALLADLPIWPGKLLMGLAFALITPIGMAIGLGVLNSFNGNDRSTIVAIGTLDAVSAGILIWVGVVDMLARDWILDGGEMAHASTPRALLGGSALVAGLVLMSLLGKWA